MISTEVIAILEKYFQFDKIFNLIDYDLSMEDLFHELSSLKRDHYENNYRFIFLHYDTEYYNTPTSPGLTISNLQKILANLDIPNYFCLILTQQNLQSTCDIANRDFAADHNSISIIQNFLHQPIHFRDSEEIQLNEQAIVKKFISLNGVGRFHRRMLLSLLKNKNLLDQGMVSYLGTPKT